MYDAFTAVRPRATASSQRSWPTASCAANLCDPEIVFQIGIEPNRVDILMGSEGLEFSPAWSRAEDATYGGEPIRVLGLDDLLVAKRTAGRAQDRLDVERLEHALERRR